MDNHDQTKLEIAAAAEEVAHSLSDRAGYAPSIAVGEAFAKLAELIRNSVSKDSSV